MGDILCLEDVPFQCQDCKGHFPTENSLKLHCFMEGHEMVPNQLANRACNCGLNPQEPHQCNSCKLIGVSVEGRRAVRRATDQVYAQSQLWKCTGCGMLWKCIDCGVLFKGSSMFRQHMPRCQNVQETLKRMKSEKGCDAEVCDAKENIHVKEEKLNLDAKHEIKQEHNGSQVEFNLDIKHPVKQEPVDTDLKCQVKQEINGNVKEECDVKIRCPIKREPSDNTENECKLNVRSFLEQEVDETSEGNRRSNRISRKRTVDGNLK